ncbi:MAG: cytochrome c biogenesis protein CcdA, partial [Bryobacteraceae bacterium]|nr:cytochrome c biogenesis protein CcdA [Bryobacteraceae bacterium]
FDENFKQNVEAFEGDLTVHSAVELAKDAPAGATELSVLVRYQACTDKECLPKKVTLTAPLAIDTSAAKPAAFAAPAGFTEFPPPGASKPGAPAGTPAPASQQSEGLAAFLLIAFGFGLASVVTPCVFPMIPITLSFFLNRPGVTRAETMKQAGLFCLGIIVLFTGMGLAVTAIVGPFGVVQLGANVWVNAFITVVFIGFGLSLLGAYEITLPSSMLTKLDQASQQGGIFGTLLMGLTFALTSFACVGPFVGTLLAGSATRGGIEPALGMMSFATGLASPFFVLAMFPSYLKALPRSGGWLARVKVVLGFIILAAALKYLSSADQVMQWNILTRDRFLAAWVVLFALPGLYLLGFLKMEGVKSDETLTVSRTLAGAAFLIFAISLLPGMFGAPLGEIDSWVPLATERAGIAGGGEGRGTVAWMKNDLDGAIAKAKAENKQVLVAFTGYACTNCHWMKANMFPRPEIAAALSNFVLVELYTDGTDDTSEANQKLQETQFQTVSIPFYAIFDTDRKVVATFANLTRKAPDFLAFLRTSPATQTTAAARN